MRREGRESGQRVSKLKASGGKGRYRELREEKIDREHLMSSIESKGW